MTLAGNIEQTLRPTVEGLGYEFLCLEQISDGRDPLLRLYIDHADGINVEDCAKVSRAISALLDVEDSLLSTYRLEVSSPGWDRPLVTAEHFLQFVGSEARIRMRLPLAGQRNFRGRIHGVEADQVVIEVDGEPRSLTLNDIEKARLVPDAAE